MDYRDELNKAIAYFQSASIQRSDATGKQLDWRHAKPIDWPALAAQAQEDMNATGKPDAEDFYAACDRYIAALGTQHSFVMAYPVYVRGLYSPNEWKTPMSEQALLSLPWAELKKTRHRERDWTPETAPTAKPSNEAPHFHLLANNRIAYMTVPWHLFETDIGPSVAFEQILRSNMLMAHAAHLQAAIVDLRGNSGGTMVPMLRGLSPLLGDGPLGAFVEVDSISPWMVDYGYKCLGAQAGPYAGNRKNFPLTDLPVAVLIGDNTCSSGEITAFSFVKRPHTVLVGQDSAGLTTGNITIPFPTNPNHSLIFTTAAMTDRENSHKLGHPISPDIQTMRPVEAALEWVKQYCGLRLNTTRTAHQIHALAAQSVSISRAIASQAPKPTA